MVRETVSIEARALASHGRIRIRLPLRRHDRGASICQFIPYV